MTTDIIFKLLCGAVVLIMALYYLRREKKLLSLIIGAVTGSAALFLINKYGGMIGVEIPLNMFNLLGSAILGVPFVVFLVIMNFL